MSAIDRLREKYSERQQERHLDITLWDGDLVIRVGLVEFAGAKGAARAVASLQDGGVDTMQLKPEDMADVISEATLGLYTRGEDGELEQLVNETGRPVRFDETFGEVIGVPEITTPRAAVYAAFQEGDPPKINALAMLMVTTQIAMWLMDPDETVEAVAKGH